MTIYKNVSIKKYNTFQIDVKAKEFVEVTTIEELYEILEHINKTKEKVFVLGGGSNVLFLKDFDGIVIRVEIKGIEKEREDTDYLYYRIGSGENWHELVMRTVQENLGGIENMALIPGTVGGAVAQNIAAYGENISEVFESLHAYEVSTKEMKFFNFEDCQFEYRNSIFKREYKNKYIITDVTLKFKKKPDKIETSYHERKSRYGSLEDELKSFAKEPYTVRDAALAVINIRNRKLPSIEDYGTAGSFFENPIVSAKKFKELEKIVPELQHYPVEKLVYTKEDWSDVKGEEYVKIPAARLLEELGWKGKWEGNVGTYKNHALCVVTNWKANGQEVLDFTNKMKQSVLDAYGVELRSEVNIV
ncbi:MAG: UDP-N-acetylmuramate dehydrogenase [Bacillota bacterium]|nr:UDP-N-acetylmuramate dehydrogenase [Bacillota bacterium]